MHKERTLTGQLIQQASSWRIAQMNRNGILRCYKIPIIVVRTLGAWVHVNISSAQKPRLMWHPSHTSAEPDPLHHLHVSFCAASVPLINLGGSNDALSALSGDSALWRTYIIYQTLEHGASIRPGLRCTKEKKKAGWRGSRAETNKRYIDGGIGVDLYIDFSVNLLS